ncbi:MAG: hypothetical protein J6T50_10500 [Lachnospiraceae bacterium]|nr:hypothetical protein [Lachnospiraceae bacterium]MBP5761660.1 hypothetical protein [Lachnospiraceae bacterium]
MENENEVLQPVKQEIRTISDKVLATVFIVAGAIAIVIGPLLLHGLWGWVLALTGLIFVFLGICGFVSLSQEAKRAAKKD